MELPEACRRAAKEIREHPDRWCRGHLIVKAYDGTVKACALGRVRLELGTAGAYDPRTVLSIDGAMRSLPPQYRRWGGITKLNDEEGQTPEFMADLLDKVADHLEFG